MMYLQALCFLHPEDHLEAVTPIIVKDDISKFLKTGGNGKRGRETWKLKIANSKTGMNDERGKREEVPCHGFERGGIKTRNSQRRKENT